MRRILKSLLNSCLLAMAVQGHHALAWGSDGHKIVAMLTEAQLSPAARKEVDRLLAQEPGATLASISTWADEHRNPATAAWHYVNFPRGDCNYQPERDCPDGKCVVAAIDRQLEVLRTPGDDEKRLTALKYVAHFSGDMHQPLHAWFGDNCRGNSYQLKAFMRGSNLHEVWDSHADNTQATTLAKSMTDHMAHQFASGRRTHHFFLKACSIPRSPTPPLQAIA